MNLRTLCFNKHNWRVSADHRNVKKLKSNLYLCHLFYKNCGIVVEELLITINEVQPGHRIIHRVVFLKRLSSGTPQHWISVSCRSSFCPAGWLSSQSQRLSKLTILTMVRFHCWSSWLMLGAGTLQEPFLSIGPLNCLVYTARKDPLAMSGVPIAP